MIGSLEVDADDGAGHLGQVPGLRGGGQAMADDQTRPPLDGVDPLDVGSGAAAQGSAASAWIAEAASVVATSKTTSPCTYT